MNNKIRIVCATRKSEPEFHADSALGQSLALMPCKGVELRLFPDNTFGLPQCYNTAIRESRTDPATLVFVHDDVYLCDFYWDIRLLKGLEQFQILGIVGNTRRVPRQPIWAYTSVESGWDLGHLSGACGAGYGFPCITLNFFGTPGVPVKLLDGLLLTARSETLLDRNLLFDERFDFHFYDMDFCRQAEERGISMGTWPISVVHESGGSFTESWYAAYDKYLQKWGD